MRKLQVGMFVLMVTSMCAGPALLGGAPANGQGTAAKIVDFDFAPRELSVTAGEAISWKRTGRVPAFQ